MIKVDLAQKGNLQARLAQTQVEIEQAYKLRYQVFCIEGSASKNHHELEYDDFDHFCDHIIILDQSNTVIGTCRLLSKESPNIKFYSETEFELTSLMSCHNNLKFLEIGRSCIDSKYRTGLAAKLLWQAIWTYFRDKNFDVMIGCASLEGIDYNVHKQTLALIYQLAAAPELWNVRANKNAQKIQPIEIPETEIKNQLKKIPPLLKGYLRLGAYVSSDVSIDTEFGTTDVFIALPKERINPRYFEHFGAPNH